MKISSRFYKCMFLVVIPAALILFSFATYQQALGQGLFAEKQSQPVPYDIYELNKTKYWKSRFDFLEEQNYNEARRRIIGANKNTLEVRRGEQKYVIYYQYQVDGDIIERVTEVTEEGDNANYKGRYFLVKYQKFLEIVYFDLEKNKVEAENENEKTYEAEVCLELPVEITEKVRYHIDSQENIWIITLSMNRVVFVQIYSCNGGKLIKEYRYILKTQQFINSLFRVVKRSELCMHIQVITYGLNRVDLQLCPSNISHPIIELATHKTNQFIYSKGQAKQWSSYTLISQSSKNNHYLAILNKVLGRLGLQFQFKTDYEPKDNSIQNIYENFDTISIDVRNNYLINLSKNKTQTGIIALDRYLINTKTPLFHGNPNYDPHSVLDLFDLQSKGVFHPQFIHKYLQNTLNKTKKMSYKAAFATVPNYKVEHIGFGSKALVFWPEQNLEDKDYLAIRTRTGALVSQKTQFKGIHEKLPVSIEEQTQRLDDKPQEVYPGLYQLHAVEQSLISKATVYERLQEFGKLELISLINGKTVFSHQIRVKQGFRYMSSFLLNNQWWIIEYNRQKKVSQAKKYQFFFMTKSDKVYSLDMVYGNITSTEYLNGEDQLSALMVKFVQEYKNGYLIVNVYRCVDEYYYIEYTDAEFSVYGVARIHFKSLSNRRFRKGRDYPQTFHKQVMVQDANLAPSKYSLKPYAIVLKNINIFKHLSYFYGEKAVIDQTWTSFCHQSGENFKKLEKINKYYYYPQNHYSLGSYGCNYNSDEPLNEKIYSFNMRHMIIQAKSQNRELLNLKKNIVYILLSIFPAYFLLVGICYAILNRNSDQQKEELIKQKSQGGKKNSKEKKNN